MDNRRLQLCEQFGDPILDALAARRVRRLEPSVVARDHDGPESEELTPLVPHGRSPRIRRARRRFGHLGVDSGGCSVNLAPGAPEWRAFYSPEMSGTDVPEKAADRYQRLVADAGRSGSLWVLSHPVESAWATFADPRGHIVVPVWPGEEQAAAMATGTWSELRPVSVSVDDFLAHEVAGLEAEGILIAAYPTPSRSGAAIRTAHFARALREARQRLKPSS
jgi:hypothetical protein